jgi:hypothetical protein
VLFKNRFLYINPHHHSLQDTGMNKKTVIPNFCLFLASLVFLTGCNETFQPLKNSHSAPFSIYGYLDASADTQWVRVTPVRKQLSQSTDKPQMNITLTQQQSGRTMEMKDSLFLPDDGFNYLNTWTTMDINPGQTYRLEAERSDGFTSQAEVTIPKEFPTPNLLDYGDGCRASLRIEGVERLADVQSIWHVRILFLDDEKIVSEREELYRLSHRNRATRIADRAYSVFIDTINEKEKIAGQLLAPSDPDLSVEMEVLQRQIFVASAGPEWIEDIASLDDVSYALPEGLSNVENGVGYMVGVVSKSIPYESCFEE